MITKSLKPLIKITVVLSIILMGSQLMRDEFVFHHNKIINGEWWRILSGNFTHSNIPHLLLNIAGLWIFTFLFIDSIKSKTFIFCIVFLSFFVGACLFFFNPELMRYYGFSGVLYGLFICGASCNILQKDYFTGYSILIFIIGKVTWDLFYGGNTTSEELIGIPVATDAHLYGLVGAIVISAIILAKQRIIKYTPPTF